ncbi:hypothetical protein VE01_05629 [Pseudogymnoascus verrucosus]|uniref:Methyltransferase domain-containing protein n=1 Tax=Pseudogymnoascus verrucosus TaxID=342668 RepID=A0A1B8GKR9_9PEZI|nr:uncharacterized protein VE01_05629 [Pseudogymnoascus verrucosus]OBT96378.2 hypothetical protein VE01_05629 [Pseudogymnoascus verrucosus]
MIPTTPPVEAPAAPSATIAAAPLTLGSAQLVPEQGSPTLEQPADSSPLPTQSDPNVEDVVEAEEVVEGGYYETDNDSGYSFEDTGSSTTSLADSVKQYRRENGRTYHSFREGVYALPNDEFEQERLDLQHHLFLLSFGEKLFLAPIKKQIHNCLDVGTGTGIWAVDFADEHPEAQVIGIDLSPIQPGFVPPNLKFIVDDAEDEWVISEKFDLIHVRMMVGSFLNWPQFFTRAYNQLHPGAYIELQDVTGLACDDTTFTYDPPSCRFAEWWKLVTEAFEKSGRDMDAAVQHKERMEAAGFVNVTVIDFKWPINTWPRNKKLKTIGMWSKENTLDALEALAMAPLTRVLKWTPEEVQMLLQGARQDIENEGIHAYWNIRAVYGQRPE